MLNVISFSKKTRTAFLVATAFASCLVCSCASLHDETHIPRDKAAVIVPAEDVIVTIIDKKKIDRIQQEYFVTPGTHLVIVKYHHEETYTVGKKRTTRTDESGIIPLTGTFELGKTYTIYYTYDSRTKEIAMHCRQSDSAKH